jgi:hypothetical protein
MKESNNTLDSRINFLWAIAIKQPKEIVKERFIEYCEEYDNLEPDATVKQKLRHREMFEKFADYMSKDDTYNKH